MSDFFGILFDGVSFGMLMFLMSVGLSVTMGVMRFLNLAHGAVAMLGGYMLLVFQQRMGIGFIPAVLLAALVSAAASAVLEFALFRRLYNFGHLMQVLLTIGVVFMSVGIATYFFGPNQQPAVIPAWLQGAITVDGAKIGNYRLFLVVVGGVIAALLGLGVARTRLGAQLRAAVDDRRMATVVGIDVGWLLRITFAIGGGLAGLGGALAVYMAGLDPTFPLTYLVLMLLVVSVGGLGSISGTLVAALVLGIIDILGKYYVPQVGSFLFYSVMVGLLLLRPAGLMRR